MAFRPTLWATALALPALVVLLALGTWQVQRLQWKNELIDTRAARIGAPAVAASELRGPGADPSTLEYRPITLAGRLRNDKAMILLNRVRGGRVGGHLVTPLELADGQGTVMIDRGWMGLSELRAFAGAPDDAVTVDGFVRLYMPPGYFVPANEPAANNWFFMNEAEMLAAADLSGPVGFYVQAGPNNVPPGTYPAGSVPDVNLRNSHLAYAVTWYALAGVLVVIFVLFHWKRRET